MQTQSTVKAVSSADLETLVNQNGIVFVDFWATWCAPCRQFSVVFEKVSAAYPAVHFAKVNIEEEEALAETFHIQSIPHLIVFKQGIVIYSESGSIPESALIELVEQAIALDVSKIKEE